MNEDTVLGLVLGVIAAAVGGIIAFRYVSLHPIGGGQPLQHRSYSATNNITPQVPGRTTTDAAPVVQNTPITEAAYNQQPTDHGPAFGRKTNQPQEEVVVPW